MIIPGNTLSHIQFHIGSTSKDTFQEKSESVFFMVRKNEKGGIGMNNTALSAARNKNRHMMFPDYLFRRSRSHSRRRTIPERSGMLKIRLQGTKNDIKWFQKLMQRHPRIEILETSDLYANKGTNRYYRSYAEIKKANIKEN